MKNLFLILIACTCLSSCATIITGTKQHVKIESVPSGATIEVNGAYKGVTPCKFKVSKKETPEIKLKMIGYSDKVIKPERGFQAIALLNLIDPIGWLIDGLSGSMKKYNPSKYEVVLDKK